MGRNPTFYQPVYWDEYFHTTIDLNLAEHGAYKCLSGLYWQNGGPLPDDMPRLQRILRQNTRADQKTFRKVLEKFFKLHEGHWHHAALDHDLAKLQRYRSLQQDKSKKAAEARGVKDDTPPIETAPVGTSTDTPTEVSTAHPEDNPDGGEGKDKGKGKRDTNVSLPLREFVGFEAFWNSYPVERRHNKKRCSEIWRTKRLDEKGDEVALGLERWKASKDWQKEAGKFIPYPQKFLNGEYWETAPTAAAVGGMTGLAAQTIMQGRQ